MSNLLKNVYYLTLCHLFPSKINSGTYGATYQVKSDIYNRQAWLCNVSKWVFGQHPEKIYFKMV